MKRIILGFGLVFMLCLIGFSENVFASSNEIETSSTSSFGSLLIKNNLERATFWADGGSVTLDYMSGGGNMWRGKSIHIRRIVMFLLVH